MIDRGPEVWRIYTNGQCVGRVYADDPLPGMWTWRFLWARAYNDIFATLDAAIAALRIAAEHVTG